MSATLTNQKCAVLQVNALEAATIAVWQPAHFPHCRALSLDLYLSLVTTRSKQESFCSYPSSGFPHIWLSSCPQTRLFSVLSMPASSRELSQFPLGKESCYGICSSVACPLKARFVS